MSDRQIVYTVIAPKEPARPVADPLPGVFDYGVGANALAPKFPRVLFGEVAQYDEAEDDVPDGYAPVRVGHGMRSRVVAAPMGHIRAVN